MNIMKSVTKNSAHWLQRKVYRREGENKISWFINW